MKKIILGLAALISIATVSLYAGGDSNESYLLPYDNETPQPSAPVAEVLDASMLTSIDGEVGTETSDSAEKASEESEESVFSFVGNITDEASLIAKSLYGVCKSNYKTAAIKCVKYLTRRDCIVGGLVYGSTVYAAITLKKAVSKNYVIGGVAIAAAGAVGTVMYKNNKARAQQA
ncbi:hypothetical protein HOM50_00105 [bacterium]|jgi:hypothetical protein|nr:hypothetical protein [bacterium]MBT5014798.1 hypothetical protein [bacterium]